MKGTYPYVTSSNPCLGGIITGLAINPRKIETIVGVVKAYVSCLEADWPRQESG